MGPLAAAGLPYYRAIVALDIECSTSRPNPIKGELRHKTYELFEAALRKAGIDSCHYDRFVDRGDGILALIHPVDQAPKAVVLNRAIPCSACSSPTTTTACRGTVSSNGSCGCAW